MKLVTPKQMQNIDSYAIDNLGVPGIELMEAAGARVVESIEEYIKDIGSQSVCIVCGKGNNGGDGFVVGRLLKEKGAIVKVFLIGDKKSVKGDAKLSLEKVEEKWLDVEEISNPDDFDIPENCTLFIDAIFGTGFSGDIREPYDFIINQINDYGVPVIAVDCPSGLDGATGNVADPTVRADVTITFGLPKFGQAVYPGKAYCGHLIVGDIGFPDKAIDHEECDLSMLVDEDASALLPHRAPDSHKGDFGKLFVLAGSEGFTGAAALTAESSLRSGAGLTVLGCPSGLNDIFESLLTEVITKPLPDVRKRRCLALRGLGEIREMIKWSDAVAVGPGIGTYHETRDLIFRLISKLDKPAVFDADALNILAKNNDYLKNHSAPLVISPHHAEMSRLTGKSVAEIEEDRIDITREFASHYNLVCILKGAPSVIADPSGHVWLNPTGNEGMATAGSGDVLTGLIGALLAQGLMDIDAAVLGCYIHGMAGELACEKLGSFGMIAGDIMRFLPEAFKTLSEA